MVGREACRCNKAARTDLDEMSSGGVIVMWRVWRCVRRGRKFARVDTMVSVSGLMLKVTNNKSRI